MCQYLPDNACGCPERIALRDLTFAIDVNGYLLSRTTKKTSNLKNITLHFYRCLYYDEILGRMSRDSFPMWRQLEEEVTVFNIVFGCFIIFKSYQNTRYFPVVKAEM